MTWQLAMHMRENLDDYIHGNFSIKQRRILFTAWIGEAWERTCANRDMVIRGFKKCGIFVAIFDGSEDDDINIKGLENYHSFEDESDTLSTDDEGTLDSNYTLAESTVPEDSITLSETTSCEFVPVDVENIILNLPAASDFMEIPVPVPQYKEE